MFKIRMDFCDYVTNDSQVAATRLLEGYQVALVNFICHPFEEGKQYTKVVIYGGINLLSN